MATIGYHRAVAEFGDKKLSGLIAWLMWSLVHVFLLIGFRNRVSVMMQWVWAYLTGRGSSPLITEYRAPQSHMSQAEEVGNSAHTTHATEPSLPRQ